MYVLLPIPKHAWVSTYLRYPGGIRSSHLRLLPNFADKKFLGVANHPNVPDDQKNASYLAAQRILDVVKAAKIDGPWGAFHLVTRVAKWLLLNPKPVNKWKKACFQEEFSI